jgi:hypothetical protein
MERQPYILHSVFTPTWTTIIYNDPVYFYVLIHHLYFMLKLMYLFLILTIHIISLILFNINKIIL